MTSRVVSCQSSYFKWPISDEPTKSWSIKTEYIPKAVVWLVNIFNCLAYDWTVKYEWTDMTWNRVSLKLVLEEAPDNFFGYIMLHPTYSLIEYFSRPEYYANIPCDWSIYRNIFPRYLELHGCVRLWTFLPLSSVYNRLV